MIACPNLYDNVYFIPALLAWLLRNCTHILVACIRPYDDINGLTSTTGLPGHCSSKQMEAPPTSDEQSTNAATNASCPRSSSPTQHDTQTARNVIVLHHQPHPATARASDACLDAESRHADTLIAQAMTSIERLGRGCSNRGSRPRPSTFGDLSLSLTVRVAMGARWRRNTGPMLSCSRVLLRSWLVGHKTNPTSLQPDLCPPGAM